MFGRKTKQQSLFAVDSFLEIKLEPKSFHGQLAAAAPKLFSDDEFQALYKSGGRPSVPPSQLAILTLLQHEAGVSDEEAINRSCYDARWSIVLGTHLGEPLCAKSTLQLFRAQLALHKRARQILKSSLDEARRKGLLQPGPLQVTIDTMPMTGAGAVKDTYNLVGTGIWRVIQAVAKATAQESAAWAQQHELDRYVPNPHGSLKGDLDIDWSDKGARRQVLTEITADPLRAYQLADAAAEALPPESAATIRTAQLLLGDLLLQDIEVKPAAGGGSPTAAIKEGTAPDRIPSATDSDQRHGHKSSSNRFTGQKSRTAVDISTKLVVDVDVLAGNAADAEQLSAQVDQVEANTGEQVKTVFGDCAMGSGSTRAEFAERDIELVAKAPAEAANNGLFPKSRFVIDLQMLTVTCPAGHCTGEHTETWDGRRVFRFGSVCATCPQGPACTTSPKGRTVHVHPQETLLQAARTLQATPEGRELLRQRLVAEHRQARLAQLGAKQARYCGHTKCAFQLLIAASIANLRRTWNWARVQAAVLGGDTCVSAPSGTV